MKKKTLIALIIVTTFWSCENLQSLEKKELTESNPTEYIFNISEDSLRQTIYDSFNEHKWIKSPFYKSSIFFDMFKEHKIYVSFRTETSPGLFGQKYFKNPDTSGDIYLYSEIPWFSPIYYTGGKPLNCRTAFIMTLKKIDDERTQLKIRPEELKVLKGVAGLTAHGFYSKEISVDPTTVEEYSLILFIAEQLGDTTLKPLNLKTKE